MAYDEFDEKLDLDESLLLLLLDLLKPECLNIFGFIIFFMCFKGLPATDRAAAVAAAPIPRPI